MTIGAALALTLSLAAAPADAPPTEAPLPALTATVGAPAAPVSSVAIPASVSAARADAPSSSGWGAQLLSYVRVLLWMLVAVLGFGVSVGVSLKAFDWFSKGFNEWEELKKGNLGVAAIFVALILASGWIVVQVMGMLSWHG